MTVYFVRHGETALNRDSRLQGQIDCPLNETGIRQAEALRERLRSQKICFERVYSSPLRRAVETARLVSGDENEIRLDDRLLEIGYGPYEGALFSDLQGEVLSFFRDPEHVEAPPGIEPIRELMARTGAFLREMETLEGPGPFLVVTHGVALRAFLGHIQGDGTGAVWGMPIENCRILAVEYAAGKWKLRDAGI